jgi:chitinase
VTAAFTLLAQVAIPVILPLLDMFPISALLTFTCATPGAIIYYTTDGSTPSTTSLTVTNGGSVVIDTVGTNTVRAFATEPSMLASPPVLKVNTNTVF